MGNTRFVAWVRREWPTLAIIALGTALQLFLVTRPLGFLLTNIVPDDAFYYFQIARNVAQGTGSTFDGVNPTNGYHPLWLVVLVPIFKLFSVGGVNDLAPIRALLALSLVLNTTTALLLARILSRFTNSRWIAAFGMLVWLLNPFMLYQTLNGLETSLALFLFAAFFLLALRIEEGKNTGLPALALLGCIAGLMIVARLDMAIYLAAYLGFMLLRRGIKDGWKDVFVTGIIATIPVGIWTVWNLIKFRMILTAASATEMMVNHQLIVQDHGESWLQTGKAVIYHSQYYLDRLFDTTAMYALACGFFGAIVALYGLQILKLPTKLRSVSVTQALAIGFLLLFIANAGIRWTVREWYFVTFEMFLAILTAVVLDALFPRITYKRMAGIALLLATVFSFSVYWSKNMRHTGGAALQMHAAAMWMNDALPEGTRVGVFNAGTQAYFSKMRVINLDGLVNNAAYDAMRSYALWQYVRDSQIVYISDFDLYMTYRYKSFFGSDPYNEMVLVRSVTDTGATPLNIYRVKSVSKDIGI